MCIRDSGGGGGRLSPGWARWGERVTGRPWPWLVGSLIVLAALAYPALGMSLGQPNDGALPEDTTMRQSYDQLQSGFGPGANGPILVTAALPVGDEASSAADPRLAKLDRALAGADGVASASPPLLNQSGDAAVITVQPTSAPSSQATADLVKRLRSQVVPEATQGEQIRVDVGGSTAGYVDLADAISKQLPLVIGVVLLLSFLLLMMAFRSLLVPLKAVVMNVISIGAAFGVVTFVFEHEWTRELIGVDAAEPVVSYVPLMMFAILFGLSMDYEVFLMSQIRERFRLGGDARGAVVGGLAATARVITAAALIMVAVFAAFVLSGDPTIKQFGIGMAAAVAIDATIIRCTLVPAVMALLGERAWALPRRLGRLVPAISIEGDAYFAERDAGAGDPEAGGPGMASPGAGAPGTSGPGKDGSGAP